MHPLTSTFKLLSHEITPQISSDPKNISDVIDYSICQSIATQITNLDYFRDLS